MYSFHSWPQSYGRGGVGKVYCRPGLGRGGFSMVVLVKRAGWRVGTVRKCWREEGGGAR